MAHSARLVGDGRGKREEGRRKGRGLEFESERRMRGDGRREDGQKRSTYNISSDVGQFERSDDVDFHERQRRRRTGIDNCMHF